MKTKVADGIVDDLVKFALIALLIVIPVRVFIAQPFVVRGASMEPTFNGGEYLIVDQLSYRLNEPERGDVIILRYPKDESVFFIKRVIGLPGETVELVGTSIIIQPAGGGTPITLDESYIPETKLQNEFGVYALERDEYFVLGDNRRESSDSRSWGPLPEHDVVGKAFVRLLPVTKIDVWPGNITDEAL